jgi:hypothetical protein
MDAGLITGFTRLAGLTGFFRPVNPVNLVNPVVNVPLFVPCVSPGTGGEANTMSLIQRLRNHEAFLFEKDSLERGDPYWQRTENHSLAIF